MNSEFKICGKKTVGRKGPVGEQEGRMLRSNTRAVTARTVDERQADAELQWVSKGVDATEQHSCCGRKRYEFSGPMSAERVGGRNKATLEQLLLAKWIIDKRTQRNSG